MDFCIYKRICTHKLDCGEWTDVGICDYYGYYMRNVGSERQQHIIHTPCKWKRRKPTKAHLKLCEECKDRFCCWTTEYWENGSLQQHKTNVYYGTIRKAREKAGSKKEQNEEARQESRNNLQECSR